LKLCECGCGQETKVASKTATSRGWIKGQPLRFINGHNTIIREYEQNKIEKSCSYCGKLFEVWPNRDETAKFCSISCKTANTNKEKARKYGELTTNNGRLKIKLPDHPYCDNSGYVFFHRHVVEAHLGYFLDPKVYAVHHIDENKSNNKLSNLVAIRHSAHMRLHALKRKFWEWSPR
jgi:endogenous inhibitor of DNA gyrase (YacG/DUF329 family)